jgi:hypothetical protein
MMLSCAEAVIPQGPARARTVKKFVTSVASLWNVTEFNLRVEYDGEIVRIRLVPTIH